MRSPDATSVHGFPGSGRLDSHTISRAAAHRYPSDGEEQWERIDHTNTLLAESAETWLRSGSDFMGVSTVRELKGKPIAGVVTAWLPKSDEGEEELYKVVHEAALKRSNKKPSAFVTVDTPTQLLHEPCMRRMATPKICPPTNSRLPLPSRRSGCKRYLRRSSVLRH